MSGPLWGDASTAPASSAAAVGAAATAAGCSGAERGLERPTRAGVAKGSEWAGIENLETQEGGCKHVCFV